MSDKRIAEWKELIRKGKENQSKEQGRLEMLMKRLKDDYEHDTVEDLDKEIAEVEAEVAEKEAKKQTLITEIENEFLDKLRAAAQ